MAKRRRTFVLLVQRDDDERRMYAEYLTQAGWTVDVATDGETALRRAQNAMAVITGLQLRGTMDGADLIARLRADARTESLPIIVITAWVMPEYRARAQAAGCDRFLTKPCRPDALHLELRSLVLERVDPVPAKVPPRQLQSRRRRR